MVPGPWSRGSELLREAVTHGRRWLSRCVVNARYRMRGSPRHDFMAEDWDVMVLLDACRTDYYEAHTPFDGTPGTRWSPGSASHEFIAETFLGRALHDTVYVTPNPHIYMLEPGTFHYVHDCRDAWDEDLQTVLPEDMTDISLEVAATYQEKRLVLHYMQPHVPYLGDTADSIRERYDIAGWNPDHRSDGVPEDRDRPLVWDLALDGRIQWSDVRTAYAETLELALSSVQRLLEDLDGRVVVTADHGELLGERLGPGGPREWAHPENLDATALRRVPWHVVQDGPRRDVVPEPPVAYDAPDAEVVEDRLAALGYTDGTPD